MNEIAHGPPLRRARVEIIPLIDVVFFLLATFVLFTLSLDRIRSLENRFPSTQGTPNDQTVFIQATEPGSFFWKEGPNGTPVLISAAEISTRLSVYKNSTATPSVFIRGDNRARFGATVMVFDEARHAGIKQVSLETITSPSGK